jgi:hypothetical protein
MMRARIAAEIEREHAIEVSCERPSSLKNSSGFGHPMDMLASPFLSIPACYVKID